MKKNSRFRFPFVMSRKIVEMSTALQKFVAGHFAMFPMCDYVFLKPKSFIKISTLKQQNIDIQTLFHNYFRNKREKKSIDNI